VRQRAFEVRAAGPPDLSDVVALDDRARQGDPARLAYLHEHLAGSRCLVAEDGAAVGFVVVRPGHFFSRDFVDLLVVRAADRRCGIGRGLLRAVLGEPGTARVFTSTNISNAPMRALLASEGWVLSGSLDGLDEGDPELVFFADR